MVDLNSYIKRVKAETQDNKEVVSENSDKKSKFNIMEALFKKHKFFLDNSNIKEEYDRLKIYKNKLNDPILGDVFRKDYENSLNNIELLIDKLMELYLEEGNVLLVEKKETTNDISNSKKADKNNNNSHGFGSLVVQTYNGENVEKTTESIEKVEKKDDFEVPYELQKRIRHLDLFLDYLKIKGKNIELVKLIQEYLEYLKDPNSHPDNKESKKAYLDIKNGIESIILKEKIDSSVIRKTRQSIRTLKNNITSKLEKGKGNILRHVEKTKKKSLLNIALLHIEDPVLNRYRNNIVDLFEENDIENIRKKGEYMDIKEGFLNKGDFFDDETTFGDFGFRINDTINSLLNDMDEYPDGLSRSEYKRKLIKELNADSKERFENFFYNLKDQLKFDKKSIDFGDGGIIEYGTVLERQRNLVALLYIMKGISHDPASELAAFSAMASNAGEGIVSLSGTSFFKELIPEEEIGVHLLFSILGLSYIGVSQWRRPTLYKLQALAEKGGKYKKRKDYYEKYKEYKDLPEKEGKLKIDELKGKYGEKIPFEVIERIQEREEIIDYLIKKYGEDTPKGKDLKKFKKFIYISGNDETFYRFLYDVEKYGSFFNVDEIKKFSQLKKILLRTNLTGKVVETIIRKIDGKDLFIGEGYKKELLKEKKLSFIKKLKKLKIDKSEELYDLFEKKLQDLGNGKKEEINKLGKNVEDLYKSIQGIIDKLEGTEFKTDGKNDDLMKKINKIINEVLSTGANFDTKVSNMISNLEGLDEIINTESEISKKISRIDGNLEELKGDIEDIRLGIKDEQLVNFSLLLDELEKIDDSAEFASIDEDFQKAIKEKIKKLLSKKPGLSLDFIKDFVGENGEIKKLSQLKLTGIEKYDIIIKKEALNGIEIQDMGRVVNGLVDNCNKLSKILIKNSGEYRKIFEAIFDGEKINGAIIDQLSEHFKKLDNLKDVLKGTKIVDSVTEQKERVISEFLNDMNGVIKESEKYTNSKKTTKVTYENSEKLTKKAEVLLDRYEIQTKLDQIDSPEIDVNDLRTKLLIDEIKPDDIIKKIDDLKIKIRPLDVLFIDLKTFGIEEAAIKLLKVSIKKGKGIGIILDKAFKAQ